VVYSVRGQRDAIADLQDSGRLVFAFDGLNASDGENTIQVVENDITFVRDAGLAGTLVYEVVGSGVDLVVTSDFGAGSLYSTAQWSCPTDE
jgi:hypothetical protein